MLTVNWQGKRVMVDGYVDREDLDVGIMSDSYEVEAIWYNGIDVKPIMTDDNIIAISELAMEAYNEWISDY